MATDTTPAPIAPRSFLPGAVTLQHFHPSLAVTNWVLKSFGPDGLADPPRPTTASLSSTFPSATDRDAVLWFHDSMQIRHEIFQGWQQAPWEGEIDEDDPRAWHFNAYISDSSESAAASGADTTPPHTASHPPGTCVGTLRLVPGPFAPHQTPGSQSYITASGPLSAAEVKAAGATALSEAEWAARRAEGCRYPATKFHDGREIFASIGRVAMLEKARGRGIATRMIDACLRFAAENPETMDRIVSGAEVEADAEGNGMDGRGRVDDVGTVWNGLVLIHAIRDVVPLYRKCGFTVDEELGVWFEAGMAHVAMWRRVEVKR